MAFEILASFWGYEHKWTIMFYAGVAILLFLFRKRFEFQGIIALNRTRLGLKTMDSWAKRWTEFIRLMGLTGIGIGYAGMLVVTIMVLYASYNTIIKPVILDGSPLVLPGVPLAGTGGIVFPLVIGWITLFIIMIVHEFSHGVVARAYDVKVKSSGIVFLGPILGAFVEPDEKQMKKKSDVVNYSILSAGPFSNILFALIILLLLSFVISPLAMNLSEQAGITVGTEPGLPADLAGVDNGVLISQVNGNQIRNLSGFMQQLEGLSPNESITVGNDEHEYEVIAGAHPDNSSKGYLGVYPKNERKPKYSSIAGQIMYSSLKWLDELFFWVWFISLNIGLINLYPIFITDGARMLKVSLDKLMKNKSFAKKLWGGINKLCLFLLFLIIFVPLLRSLFNLF